VINPNPEPRTATLEIPGLTALVDALDGRRFHARFGAVELSLSPQRVQLFELEL
jgi:hypothetical protein